MPKSGTLDPCEVPTQRNERIWSTDKKKRKEKSIRQNKMKQYFKASSKTQSSASVNRLGTNSATSSANSLFENKTVTLGEFNGFFILKQINKP